MPTNIAASTICAPTSRSSSTATTTAGRLHSALGYTTPEEFEASCATQTAAAEPAVSFSRHGEIYRWKENGDPVEPASPPHPIDESPAGYCLTGWSPPEPASASPVAQL
jgi:hypothetical protein